jgi:hypothetical protein
MEKGKVIKEELMASAGAFSAAVRDDLEDLDALLNSPGHLSPPPKVVHEMQANAKAKVKEMMGSGSSGETSSSSLSRYPSFQEYNPARFSMIHAPDWDLMHESRFTDPTACITFVTKSIPPAEALAISKVPSVDLAHSAFSQLASFQSDFSEMYKRWDLDAFHAVNMAKEIVELKEKLKVAEAVCD